MYYIEGKMVEKLYRKQDFVSSFVTEQRLFNSWFYKRRLFQKEFHTQNVIAGFNCIAR